MTTTVYEAQKITLIDGTEISVRPLKISLLREFNKKFAEISAVAEDDDKSMDILMACVTIAMKQYDEVLAADTKALEEKLDLPTVYRIIEEASGVKLGDGALVNATR
jgi:hypothetical protein